MTHSPTVKQIDTVRAYYCGPRLIVEVDVVIDKLETVEVAHDTAEALQIKLEKLPTVERAYVHIDYETTHNPVRLLPCPVRPRGLANVTRNRNMRSKS